MSTLAVNTITNAAGGNTATINGMTPTAQSLQGFRNRILNGGMVIDQRNAGASVTPNQSDGSVRYLVDRFGYSATQASKVSWQRSTVAPAGFTNSLIGTVVSATTVGSSDQFTLCQFIEGFNTADLGWGTASAQAITMSFWVRSSVTGTYSAAFGNNAFNRQYIGTYTVNAANTWELKTITVPGDTSGTWATDNSAGIRVNWDLGSGSAVNGTAGAWQSGFPLRTSGSVTWISNTGATFYITGVQLEAGSVATPFERRPYSTELQLAQRYYETVPEMSYSLYSDSSAYARTPVFFKVNKRSSPSVTLTATGVINYNNSSAETLTVAGFSLALGTLSSGIVRASVSATVSSEL